MLFHIDPVLFHDAAETAVETGRLVRMNMIPRPRLQHRDIDVSRFVVRRRILDPRPDELPALELIVCLVQIHPRPVVLRRALRMSVLPQRINEMPRRLFPEIVVHNIQVFQTQR